MRIAAAIAFIILPFTTTGLPGSTSDANGNQTINNGELTRVVEELVLNLEKAWNNYDSRGYAENFHPSADFVDVLGRMIKGREAIARIHERNFATIHVGSKVRYEVLSIQKLSEGVALAHVKGQVNVPAGPLAGVNVATQTWVLVDTNGKLQIRALHNTFIREMPGVPGIEQ